MIPTVSYYFATSEDNCAFVEAKQAEAARDIMLLKKQSVIE